MVYLCWLARVLNIFKYKLLRNSTWSQTCSSMSVILIPPVEGLSVWALRGRRGQMACRAQSVWRSLITAAQQSSNWFTAALCVEIKWSDVSGGAEDKPPPRPLLLVRKAYLTASNTNSLQRETVMACRWNPSYEWNNNEMVGLSLIVDRFISVIHPSYCSSLYFYIYISFLQFHHSLSSSLLFFFNCLEVLNINNTECWVSVQFFLPWAVLLLFFDHYYFIKSKFNNSYWFSLVGFTVA